MKKEIKIALAAIAALVIIFLGMNFLKGKRMFSHSERYYIAFRDITGVTTNCAIYAEGVVVGSVQGINYDYTHAEPTKLLCAINENMVIPEGTRAEIVSDLMGNVHISLTLGDYANHALAPEGIIYGNEDLGLMDAVKGMIPTMEQLVPKVDSIITALNILLNDPALARIINNVDGTTANLNVLTTQLAPTATQLNALSSQLSSQLPSLMDKADRVLDNTSTLTDNLNALDLQGTMSQVNSTVADAQSTINNLNSSVSTTLADADSLMIDLKQNPKRYVHFSVFGKK